MHELVIDRRVWFRGEGASASRLLRFEDGKRCCVGIYLQSLGTPDNVMCDVMTAKDLQVPPEAEWLHFNDKIDHGVDMLYEINDDTDSPTEACRETKIAEEFAKHDVSVKFVDGVPK